MLNLINIYNSHTQTLIFNPYNLQRIMAERIKRSMGILTLSQGQKLKYYEGYFGADPRTIDFKIRIDPQYKRKLTAEVLMALRHAKKGNYILREPWIKSENDNFKDNSELHMVFYPRNSEYGQKVLANRSRNNSSNSALLYGEKLFSKEDIGTSDEADLVFRR